MQGVSHVLKRYGQQYLDAHGTRMTAQQKKVLRAVMACREDRLGTIRYRCVGCGESVTVPRSCCNRHCPGCQHGEQQTWLEKQRQRLLPCHYFLITFTLPAELRPVAMGHPEEVYRAMMSAASESLKTAATNPRHVGAVETGLMGVLHTWGRDLSYHPHVHFVVPGGGIGQDGNWHSSRQSVFVPEQILERLFRGKLKAKLLKLLEADCFAQIPASVWQGRFVVDSKAVGNGQHALKYLAPYVIRGAVSNWRVTACDEVDSIDDASLVLQVKRSGRRRYRGMPLSVTEFIRRWLQHVLPSGLHRVRHYGFLNSRNKRSIEELRLLIAIFFGLLHYFAWTEEIVSPPSVKMTCPHCGCMMLNVGYTPPAETLERPESRDWRAASTVPARAPP